MLVDGSNAFFLKEANLDGLLGPVKRSHKQLQEAARASTGNILTTIQIREALSRDVLVPWRGWRPELFKSARTMSEWSDTQLLFLQAVYNARQLRYDSLEYDLLTDSMIRLQEYVGIETDELQDLLDADVLRHDTDHPHRLYSVTADGRAAIGESYRKGVDYGHGQCDLGRYDAVCRPRRARSDE